MPLATWSEQALALLGDALEPELEQLLVCDVLVLREGTHYRIEGAPESWAELEAAARRLEGICDCGAVLSQRGERLICRTCCREYGP